MATSSFPSVVTGVTVETATSGALSGDGSSGNKLTVSVDHDTITVNDDNELVASGGITLPIALSAGDVLAGDGAEDLIGLNADGSSYGIVPSIIDHVGLLSIGISTTGSPSLAEALASNPSILFMWQAGTSPVYGDSGDVVVFIQESGALFYAEVLSGDLTGMSKPDFASVMDPGDTISDGDITWTKTAAATLASVTPTTWQADHAYTMPACVYPTVPNGHVYCAYGPLTADSSEPDFDSITFSNYIPDNDGYWMDAGGAAAAGWHSLAEIFSGAELDVDTLFVSGGQSSSYRLTVNNTGLVAIKADKGFQIRDLPTGAGSANSKVLCVDAAGNVYVSGSGTDCSD